GAHAGARPAASQGAHGRRHIDREFPINREVPRRRLPPTGIELHSYPLVEEACHAQNYSLGGLCSRVCLPHTESPSRVSPCTPSKSDPSERQYRRKASGRRVKTDRRRLMSKRLPHQQSWRRRGHSLHFEGGHL